METEKLLIALCRTALDGGGGDASLFASIDDESWSMLYRLAKHHDLAHLVAEATGLLSLAPPEEIRAKLEKQSMIALYRTEQMSWELASLTAVLTEAKIPHLPLKGSVLRSYYRSPELRLSCDIDLLVRPDDLARAKETLTCKLGYTEGDVGPHDVQLYAPSGLHVELHFDLIESGFFPEAAAILADVWRYASPVCVGSYTLCLSDEAFYFYHIAHMAKHFSFTGGCGVRPFLDLYVLYREGKCGGDAERARLLSSGGLALFEEAAVGLMRVWMMECEPTALTSSLSDFVLTGGTYGITRNRVAAERGRGKSRFRYLLARLFPPLSSMRFRFPVLKRAPILLPLCYFLRLLSPLWSGRYRRLLREARTSGSITEQESAEVGELLLELGLLKG